MALAIGMYEIWLGNSAVLRLTPLVYDGSTVGVTPLIVPDDCLYAFRANNIGKSDWNRGNYRQYRAIESPCVIFHARIRQILASTNMHKIILQCKSGNPKRVVVCFR